MKLKIIYRFAILTFLCFYLQSGLTSCKDDFDPVNEDQNVGLPSAGEQYSLDFIVTLDAMGDEKGKYNPYKEIENYIDPQKFRVLFFDGDNKFLFESRQRYVKNITDEEDADNVTWYVSVPLYGGGNDSQYDPDHDKVIEEYDWDFESIRNVLMTENFKIALLVNRPLNEYCDDYAGMNDVDVGGEKGWFPNNSPEWTRADSRFPKPGVEDKTNCKRVFDIHHAQREPTYQNKGKPSGWDGEGLYNFIMGNCGTENNPVNCTLSSFVSWVNWHGQNDADQPNKVQVTDKPQLMNKAQLPSKGHPIPMYGIQEFEPISDWEKGIPFTLGRDSDNPISLLRSAVKLDLVLPAGKLPDMVILMYSNIYSHCEPMDIWTPTEKIWKDHDTECEWKSIMNFGPMVKSTDSSIVDNSTDAFNTYRKRLSWFYGAWLDNGFWDFGTLKTSVGVQAAGADTPYPKVFNPLIQRNVGVYCYGPDYTDAYSKDDNGNIHIMLYTGERNINDPSNQTKLKSTGPGSRTLIYWALIYDKTIRCFPIADYGQTANTALLNRNTTAVYDKKSTGDFQSMSNPCVSEYETYMSTANTNVYHRNWPLIRNHVYRIKLGQTKGDDSWENVIISSEDSYTKDIYFPQAKSRLKKKKDDLTWKASLKAK
ncbi:MAG: hypothetical protein J1F12_01470 [Muribaculaceae bacterium]|nr:hypothetical protein [Muribaculaceae bacterium]